MFLPPAVQPVLPPGNASLNHHCVDDYLHISWPRETCELHPLLADLNVTLKDCMLSCQRLNETRPAVGALDCGAGGDRWVTWFTSTVSGASVVLGRVPGVYNLGVGHQRAGRVHSLTNKSERYSVPRII